MAYTVDLKSDQLTQKEGQLTGSDPLRVNQLYGKVRMGEFRYARAASITAGTYIGLTCVPKGAKVIGISTYFLKSTNDSAITYSLLKESDGSSGPLTTGAVHAGTVAAYTANTWVANIDLASALTEDCVLAAAITTADTGANPVISGHVLYTVD